MIFQTNGGQAISMGSCCATLAVGFKEELEGGTGVLRGFMNGENHTKLNMTTELILVSRVNF
jgi:hypothetical protein